MSTSFHGTWCHTTRDSDPSKLHPFRQGHRIHFWGVGTHRIDPVTSSIKLFMMMTVADDDDDDEVERMSKKSAWPILKYYPSVYLEGQRKTSMRIAGFQTKNQFKVSGTQCRNSNCSNVTSGMKV